MNVLADGLDWVQPLGWSLLHFIWQGAIIGGIFGVVRAILPTEQSTLRYAWGLAALVGLALCPLGTLWVLHARADTLSIAASSISSVTLDPVVAVVASTELIDAWLPWLVALWIFGVALMFGRAVYQWRGLDRIASRLAYRRADVEEILARVALQFARFTHVRVLVSQHIDTPTLIGWFNPVILLPAAIVLRFPRQQLELILAHELGHLRRYDHLVNLAQAVIETVLFYHPVVHWISRDVRHEREVCCDKLVLRITEGEPREYARTLAALEHLRQLPAQLAVAASGGMLLDRIRRIVGLPQPRSPARRLRLGAWILLSTIVCGTVTGIVLMRPGADVSLDVFTQPARPDAWRGVNSTRGVALVPSVQVDLVALPALRLRVADEPVIGPAIPTPAIQGVPAPARDGIGQQDEIASARISPAMPDQPAADFTLAAMPAVVASINVADGKSRPRLLRRVAPVYPDVNDSGSRGHVEFEFAIDKSGSVRDITIVSGDSLGSYAFAARRALRQWRFDPSSLQAYNGDRFRQDFVFVGLTNGRAENADPICPRDTGSHLCRPGRGNAMNTAVGVAKSGVSVSSSNVAEDSAPSAL